MNMADFNAFLAEFEKIGALDYDQVEKEMDIFQREFLRMLDCVREMVLLTEEYAETVREIVLDVEVKLYRLKKRVLLKKSGFVRRFNIRWHTAATGTWISGQPAKTPHPYSITNKLQTYT